MDRISDSGSDGCGSIPHGGTRTGRIDATCSCLSPSHFVTAPGGMPSLPLVVPGDLFAFPYFASKIPGPVARLMAQSLRSELSPSHFVTAPGGMPSLPSVVPGDLSDQWKKSVGKITRWTYRRCFVQKSA